MPIYEYLCEHCEQTSEVLQKVDEKAPEQCPHCGEKQTLKKTVSNSAFHLKGGGWYKDLYASPKPSETSSCKKAEGSANSCDNKKCDKS